MSFGFAIAVIAFGLALGYKGYRGWSWQDFYSNIFGGK